MGKQLFFIGYMAAGKTAAAAELAKLTGLPFLDLDAELEARHGRSIAELFAASGEPEFRRKEAALLQEITGNEAYQIIACGGGLPCTPGTVELMQSHGHGVVGHSVGGHPAAATGGTRNQAAVEGIGMAR